MANRKSFLCTPGSSNRQKSPNSPGTSSEPSQDEQDLLDLEYNNYLQVLMRETLYDESHKNTLNDIDQQAVQATENYEKLFEKNHQLENEINSFTNKLEEMKITDDIKHLIENSKLETEDVDKTLNIVNNITRRITEESNKLSLKNITYVDTPENREKLVDSLKDILRNAEKLNELYVKNKMDVVNDVSACRIKQDEILQRSHKKCSELIEKVTELIFVASADKFLMANNSLDRTLV